MELEDQVASLDLCMKLKSLGMKQDSCFYWRKDGDELFLGNNEHVDAIALLCSAYTVAELGEILPDCLYATTASAEDRPIFMNKIDGVYSVGILNPNKTIYPRFIGKSEANARADLLIYLLEQSVVKNV